MLFASKTPSKRGTSTSATISTGSDETTYRKAKFKIVPQNPILSGCPKTLACFVRHKETKKINTEKQLTLLKKNSLCILGILWPKGSTWGNVFRETGTFDTGWFFDGSSDLCALFALYQRSNAKVRQWSQNRMSFTLDGGESVRSIFV